MDSEAELAGGLLSMTKGNNKKERKAHNRNNKEYGIIRVMYGETEGEKDRIESLFLLGPTREAISAHAVPGREREVATSQIPPRLRNILSLLSYRYLIFLSDFPLAAHSIAESAV